MSGERALLLEGAIHHLYHVGSGSTAVTVDVACIKALTEGFYFFFEGFHFFSEFLHLAFYHVAILVKIFDDVAKITPSVSKGIFILRSHGHVNATIGGLYVVELRIAVACGRCGASAVNVARGGAFIESISSNARNGARDDHRGQAAAILEGRLSNACYRRGNFNRGKVAAPIVFANFFISTTYTLKGRKVKSKNLQLMIKLKI